MSYNYFDLFLASLNKYRNDQKWDNSLFENMKHISNTHVGSVGQDFIEQLCSTLGLACEFPMDSAHTHRQTQSPWDIKIESITFELKTATQDTTNAFQFNHIRYHRTYDAVLCLGVAPNQLYFNVWTKADIVTGKAGRLVSMEKGANASYKLTKRVSELKEITCFHEIMAAFIQNYKH